MFCCLDVPREDKVRNEIGLSSSCVWHAKEVLITLLNSWTPLWSWMGLKYSFASYLHHTLLFLSFITHTLSTTISKFHQTGEVISTLPITISKFSPNKQSNFNTFNYNFLNTTKQVNLQIRKLQLAYEKEFTASLS